MYRLIQRPFLCGLLPSQLSLISPAPCRVGSNLQAATCIFDRRYSVPLPLQTVDGFLNFPVHQPPSRLTLLFPYSQTDVKVVTGGYETIQVKVSSTPDNYSKQLPVHLSRRVLTCLALQVAGDAVLASGDFEIEYDGSHVGQPPRLRANLPSQIVIFVGKLHVDWSPLSGLLCKCSAHRAASQQKGRTANATKPQVYFGKGS